MTNATATEPAILILRDARGVNTQRYNSQGDLVQSTALARQENQLTFAPEGAAPVPVGPISHFGGFRPIWDQQTMVLKVNGFAVRISCPGWARHLAGITKLATRERAGSDLPWEKVNRLQGVGSAVRGFFRGFDDVKIQQAWSPHGGAGGRDRATIRDSIRSPVTRIPVKDSKDGSGFRTLNVGYRDIDREYWLEMGAQRAEDRIWTTPSWGHLSKTKKGDKPAAAGHSYATDSLTTALRNLTASITGMRGDIQRFLQQSTRAQERAIQADQAEFLMDLGMTIAALIPGSAVAKGIALLAGAAGSAITMALPAGTTIDSIQMPALGE